MEVPEIYAEIELQRAVLKLGFAPSEFLGAKPESLKDSLIVYKTLLDWVRSKGWRLSDAEIVDIESAMKEKLTDYSPTRFGFKKA